MKYTIEEFLGAFETGNITIEDIADRMFKLEAKLEKYEKALKRIADKEFIFENDSMEVAGEALED